jgi:hypothetical protein
MNKILKDPENGIEFSAVLGLDGGLYLLINSVNENQQKLLLEDFIEDK